MVLTEAPFQAESGIAANVVLEVVLISASIFDRGLMRLSLKLKINEVLQKMRTLRG